MLAGASCRHRIALRYKPDPSQVATVASQQLPLVCRRLLHNPHLPHRFLRPREINFSRPPSTTSTKAALRKATYSIRPMSSYFNNIVNTSAFSYLQTTIVASSSLALVLSGLLYFKQSELIYPRNLPPDARTNVPSPDIFGVREWKEVTLRTPDGEVLKSFFLRASSEEKKNITILMLHGNAGNIGHRVPIAKVFSDQMGCNVLMLSYRGYGFSTGKPSEKGLCTDAQTALNWIYEDEETRDTKKVIYGQSLGGALGIQIAAKNQDKLSGMILENTFRSMRSLIPTAFPPARYLARLCHQIWPSETTLPEITRIPILFLSGLKDELIPPEHMATLYDVSKAKKKIWKTLKDGTHNETVAEEGYFEYIFNFLEEEVEQLKKES